MLQYCEYTVQSQVIIRARITAIIWFNMCNLFGQIVQHLVRIIGETLFVLQFLDLMCIFFGNI